jgi:hypothetical protein
LEGWAPGTRHWWPARPGWQWAAGQQVLRKTEDLEEDCCRFTAGIRVCLIR